jgi:hypothetical protein
MVGLFGQTEVVKVNGSDGSPSGTDNATLKMSDQDDDNAGYYMERLSPSCTSSTRTPFALVQHPIYRTAVSISTISSQLDAPVLHWRFVTS